MKTTTITKTLHVTGILWQGIESEGSYPLTDIIPTDLHSARKLASDFSELHSASVVTSKKTIDETIENIL